MKEHDLSERTRTILYRVIVVLASALICFISVKSKSAWDYVIEDFKEIHTKREASKTHNLEVAEDIRATVNGILTNLKKQNE